MNMYLQSPIVLPLIIDAGIRLCADPTTCIHCASPNRMYCYWGLMDLWALRRTCKALYTMIGDERRWISQWRRIRDVLTRYSVSSNVLGRLRRVIQLPRAKISGSFLLEHIVYGEKWSGSNGDIDLFVMISDEELFDRKSPSNAAIHDLSNKYIDQIHNIDDWYIGNANIPSVHFYVPLAPEKTMLDIIMILDQNTEHTIDQYIDDKFDMNVCKVTSSIGTGHSLGTFIAQYPLQLIERKSLYKFLPILYDAPKMDSLRMYRHMQRIHKYQRRGFQIRLHMVQDIVPQAEQDTQNRYFSGSPISMEQFLSDRVSSLRETLYLYSTALTETAKQLYQCRVFIVALYGMSKHWIVGDANELPSIDELLRIARNATAPRAYKSARNDAT